MGKRIDLTGLAFGRLVVLGYSKKDAYNSAVWKCRCECGVEKDINGASLRTGATTSCGCLQREVARSSKNNLSHGYHNTPTYFSWQNMLTRCTNPNYKQWNDYGGRGITVCERWRTFENFLADMGEKPDDSSIDRKDNDGNYEPGNCQWVTRAEQSMNKRTTITWGGKTVAQWAADLGVNYYTIQRRLKKFGTLFPENIRITSRTPEKLK